MSISSDLISNILVRLPVKSLLRFQLLSKEWYGKIHGSSFVKNHLSTAANRDRIVFIKQQPDAKHPLDCCGVRFNEDDEFEGGLESIRQPHVTCVYFGRMHSTHIVGYCNGLVCLRHYSIACVIWNPLIRRYKELPPVPSKLPAGFTEKHAYDFNVVSWDFGYEPGENDYKVLRVVQFSRRSDASVNITAVVGELYSLRADSWKTVEDPWPKDCRLYNSVYPPLFNLISASLNGAVHWLVLTGRKDEIKSDLMVFNLATEKFRKYKIPVQLGEEGDLARLVVLRGCICMCTDVSVTAKEVWMMEEYGVDSWTRLYTIVLDEVRWGPRERVLESSSCKPLVYPKDGKKVLMEHHCDCLFWYDIEERRGTRVPLPGLGGFFCTVICVGNLALLDCDSVSILTDKEDEIGFSRPVLAPKQKDAPKEEPSENSPVKTVPSAKAKRKLNGDDAKAVSSGAPPKKVKTENELKPSLKEETVPTSKSSAPSKGIPSSSSKTSPTSSAGPFTEEEIRAVLMQETPVTTKDLVANFNARIRSPEDKKAFVDILKNIAKIQRTNGSDFVVLKDR